jgi:aldehyde:ferredoxin oxidoreductase
MLKALEMLLNAEGELGKVLGQGSERAAKIWGKGADEYLITVKGAEAPAHMPQAKRSLGLIYAVNPFGADHQSSEHDPYYEEGVADLNLNRLKTIGLSQPQPGYSLTPEKVRFAYLTEVFYSMLDSVELCQFVFGPAWTLYGPVETVEMVRAVTGWDITLEELMQVGERRLNLFRTFNAREGLDRKADKLPKKFFRQLAGSGPTAGIALTHEEVESAIDEYYKLAGWTANGVPTRATLKKHGIGWAAEYLPA